MRFISFVSLVCLQCLGCNHLVRPGHPPNSTNANPSPGLFASILPKVEVSATALDVSNDRTSLNPAKKNLTFGHGLELQWSIFFSWELTRLTNRFGPPEWRAALFDHQRRLARLEARRTAIEDDLRRFESSQTSGDLTFEAISAHLRLESTRAELEAFGGWKGSGGLR